MRLGSWFQSSRTIHHRASFAKADYLRNLTPNTYRTMTTVRASTVFRIQNVPSESNVTDLEQILREKFSEEETLRVKVNITFVPSCYTSKRVIAKCALVEFKPTPGFLQRVEKDMTGSEMIYLDAGDMVMTIDVNFYGFTQLYDVEGMEITADIVAVTGLGGHAYGSWRGKETKKMWLRDFLSQDLPTCRTMTYGYNSNLKSRGFHTLKDYKNEFLHEIAGIRNSEEERKRPIIFIGHSFGGIVILQSLVQAANTKGENGAFVGDEYLVAATCVVMFFGTPHRGILMKDVRKMLEEDTNRHPRLDLLEEIENEPNLEPDLKEFIKLAEDLNLKIVSFYERIQTAEVAKNSKNQYMRSGKFKSTLDIDSAVLHLPDHLEETIPVDADHTNIVKFEYKDRTYDAVVKRVQKYTETASEEVQKRFRLLDTRADSPISIRDSNIMASSLGIFLGAASVITPLIYVCTKGYEMLLDARNIEDLGNLQIRRKVAKQKFNLWGEKMQPQDDGLSAFLGPASRKYVVVVEILAKKAECFRKMDYEFTMQSKLSIADSSLPQSATSESVAQQVRRRLVTSNSNLRFWSESNPFNNSSLPIATLALSQQSPIRNFIPSAGRTSWIPKAVPAAPVMTPIIGLSSYVEATGLGSLRFPSAKMLAQLGQMNEAEILGAVEQFKENGRKFQETVSAYRNRSRWALHNRGREDLIKMISELESHNNTLFKITENVKQARGVLISKTVMASIKADFNVHVDLPFHRNPKFCGRDDIIDKLAKILEPCDPTKSTPNKAKNTSTKPGKKSVVLYGLGGAGKSQVALEYAYRFSGFYTSVLWIDANDSELTKKSALNIVQQLVAHFAAKQQAPSDFQEIAKNLGIQGKIDLVSGKIDPSAAELAIKAVHAWLSGNGNQGWLLLVDNYEKAELDELDKIIPRCDWGSVIVTTRIPNLDRFGECVEVEEIGAEAGLQLLLKSSGKLAQNLDDSELDEAKEIVRALGELPLALDQAGAYIRSLQTSFRAYGNKFKKSMKTSFKKSVPEVGLMKDKASVLTTWELSFKELDENARYLLHLCAFLSNEDIPEELFYRGKSAVLDWLEEDDDALDDAMESLFNLSLVTRKQSRDSFWMHPLVHSWARERNNSTIRRQLAEDSITLITSAIVHEEYKRTSENWIFERRILGHLNVCQKNISEYFGGQDMIKAADTLNILGTVYARLGYYKLAEELYRKVLAWCEKARGSDHQSTLDAMNNIAISFSNQGRYDEAQEWYRKTLAGFEKVLGSDHPSTMDVVSNMANVLNIQGRHDEALGWYERVLAVREKKFGSEHPSTMDTVNNIANVFNNQGRYDEALLYYQKVLAVKEKELGSDHPTTLGIMDNMANIFDNQGRYEEALQWFQKSLAGCEKTLGSDHPDTLITVHNMANIFKQQGRYEKAMELYRKALVGKEKSLGSDHPTTMNTVSNIAIVFEKQGQYDEALEWHPKALAGFEKSLGSDHPITLNALKNMANVFCSQGQYDGALALYRRALAGEEKALGNDHPDTLATVYNMANLFKLQGQYEKAVECYEKALAGFEKVLGSGHPSTLSTVSSMAGVFKQQGQYDKALEWYRKALLGREKALGSDHPLTMETVNNMAVVFKNQGRYDKAHEWYQKVLAGTEKALGSGHPSTLSIMKNIANVFYSQGQHDEALALYRKVLAGEERALGNDHPSTLETVNNIALIYTKFGNYNRAAALYQKALAGSEKALGSDHPSTLSTMNNIGSNFNSQGRYDKALEWYQKSLAGREKVLGSDHPSTLETVNDMAVVFSTQGRYDEALDWYQKSLAGKTKALGKKHPSTLQTMKNLAVVFKKLRRYNESLEYCQKLLAGFDKVLGSDHPTTLSTMIIMANLLDSQGRHTEALELRQKAQTLQLKKFHEYADS